MWTQYDDGIEDRLSAFDEDLDTHNSDPIEFEFSRKPQDDLPFSFFNRKPLKANNSKMENHGVPYEIRDDGIFVNGKDDYKVNVVPVIVEKDKKLYLRKTTLKTAEKEIRKTMKQWIEDGYELYFDDEGVLHRRHRDGIYEDSPKNQPSITTR